MAVVQEKFKHYGSNAQQSGPDGNQ